MNDKSIFDAPATQHERATFLRKRPRYRGTISVGGLIDNLRATRGALYVIVDESRGPALQHASTDDCDLCYSVIELSLFRTASSDEYCYRSAGTDYLYGHCQAPTLLSGSRLFSHSQGFNCRDEPIQRILPCPVQSRHASMRFEC